MHEASIAAGILDIVQHHVPAVDGPRVRAIRVRVGDLAGSEYGSAFLEIDRIAARGECSECGKVAALGSLPPFTCPACGSPFLITTSGDDLSVVDVELDDATGGRP